MTIKPLTPTSSVNSKGFQDELIAILFIRARDRYLAHDQSGCVFAIEILGMARVFGNIRWIIDKLRICNGGTWLMFRFYFDEARPLIQTQSSRILKLFIRKKIESKGTECSACNNNLFCIFHYNYCVIITATKVQ